MILKLATLTALLAVSPAQDAEQPVEPLPETVISEAPEVAALRQVQAFMTATNSLKGSFVQQMPSGQVARGTMYLERPGRVRFEYNDETPFLYVSDGNQITMIDYDVGQVTRWPVKDTPLRLILGRELDLTRFDSSVIPDYAGYKELVAVRARDREKPEYGEFTIIFRRDAENPEKLHLYRWAVADDQGGVNVMEVTNLELNPVLAESLWEFEDPRGLRKRRRRR